MFSAGETPHDKNPPYWFTSSFLCSDILRFRCFQVDIKAAFGLSSKMIIRDVVVKEKIFKPEHQKTFRAIPERVCEFFHKK